MPWKYQYTFCLCISGLVSRGPQKNQLAFNQDPPDSCMEANKQQKMAQGDGSLSRKAILEIKP